MKIVGIFYHDIMKFILPVMALTIVTGSIYGSNEIPNKKTEKIRPSKKLLTQQEQLYPLEYIDFHSSRILIRSHPFLFYSETDIKTARKRIRDFKYNKPLETLNKEADEAGRMVLDSIDRSWWDKVKSQPWSETYPVIFEKTCLVPLRIIRPAYYAALRYAISEDQTDAETAKKALLHLSDYSFEFEHYDVGMNYSVWGYFALTVYDILFEHFSPDERTKIDAFFARMGKAIMKNDIYWIENNIGGGINNHLAWHKMMLGCLGIFYGQDKLIDYALHGRRGVLSLLELGLVDDGLWCESSLNYHFTAIVPMIYMAEALRNVGYPEDLYTITTANGRNIRQSFNSVFGVLFPDGSIPPIGDAYGHRKFLHDEFTYVYVWKAYRDSRYAWLLEQGSRVRPELLFIGQDTKGARHPDITSKLYPEHGYAFLRDRQSADYWGSDGWCAFLTFDKSGVHTNQDKLSLMLFGCGKLLIPDVEARASAAHAFSSQVQRELNRSALSQNTVMIDYRDQRSIGRKLRLEEYRDLPEEKVVTAADNQGLLYEGIKQSRTICVRPEYVLDIFQVHSDANHDIHWIIHGIGSLESQKNSVPLEASKMSLPGPGRWLRDFKSGASDEEIHIKWSEDSVQFEVVLAGESKTKIISCGYPETDDPNCSTIPMLLVGRKAAHTIYAAVYQVSKRKLSNIHITPIGTQDGRLVFEVTGPWGERRHLIPKLQ